MEFKFLKLVESIVFRCFRTRKPVGFSKYTAYAWCNRQGKQAFVKENDLNFLLETCQLYIIAKYKASNCCKIEAVIQRCSVKKEFLEILQNSQENPFARVSFLIKLQFKKRLWNRCFSVNIAKILRTAFFIEHFRWLPLVKLKPTL